ncbi:fungal hydrophobin [Paxillus involutus ATCC 200175]|nr:fungal hydrophobin [Paxillus involutus ATCC 200175]
MLAGIPALLTIILAAVTSARIERHVRRDTNIQCNTGNVQCCNSVSSATNFADILDKLGSYYDPADNVGVDCTPINVMGGGESAGCQQQPLCCRNNTYSGYINVGCSPFDFN